MNAASPFARIDVGVVVERRRAESQWIDFNWQPVAVLAGVPDAAAWTILSTADGVTTFYAGAAKIALYRSETVNYMSNLETGAPTLWVALRPTGFEPPYEILAVTADPAEGESFTQVGDDVVEALPMPPQVLAIVGEFVAEHHVERPFAKRKRDRADPEALGGRAPNPKGRGR